jgi:NosR/NirI family nitrous oxide reductase transcriptional regulator
MPTDPVTPPYAATTGAARWCAELWDHLWPWSGPGWRCAAALQLAGVAVALAATVAWALAAGGQLRAGAVIGWWLGWSLYEVLIRLSAKRYVKDGPWWRGRHRRATVMDMLSYVGFKNLLVGAALFLALKAMGMLAA